MFYLFRFLRASKKASCSVWCFIRWRTFQLYVRRAELLLFLAAPTSVRTSGLNDFGRERSKRLCRVHLFWEPFSTRIKSSPKSIRIRPSREHFFCCAFSLFQNWKRTPSRPIQIQSDDRAIETNLICASAWEKLFKQLMNSVRVIHKMISLQLVTCLWFVTVKTYISKELCAL